jgi:hypothetical protein
MNTSPQLGSKVRLLHDDGWGSPGCVIGKSGQKLRVYWPDENVFTDHFPVDLSLYDQIASQSNEVAA